MSVEASSRIPVYIQGKEIRLRDILRLQQEMPSSDVLGEDFNAKAEKVFREKTDIQTDKDGNVYIFLKSSGYLAYCENGDHRLYLYKDCKFCKNENVMLFDFKQDKNDDASE